MVLAVSGVVSLLLASGTGFLRKLGAGGDVVIVGAAVVAVRDAWHPSWALGRPVVVCGVTSLAALERLIRDPHMFAKH